MADFGRVSTLQASTWIAEMASIDTWLALAQTDPFIGDPLAAEVLGGAYVRQAASFGVTIAQMETLGPAIFKSLAVGTTIAAVMLFDSLFNGNMLAGYVFEVPVYLADGGTYTVNAGQFVVGIDVSTI